jgi:hypothetical protein
LVSNGGALGGLRSIYTKSGQTGTQKPRIFCGPALSSPRNETREKSRKNFFGVSLIPGVSVLGRLDAVFLDYCVDDLRACLVLDRGKEFL